MKGSLCLAVNLVPVLLISPMEDAGCVKNGGYFEKRSICHFRRQREQKETFLSSNKQAKLKQTSEVQEYCGHEACRGNHLKRFPEL